jgi:4-amino-4-deoxy-L-arabinose transferase-like glycosyltransferase
MPDKTASWQRDCLRIAILTIIFFSIGLGTRPYTLPSEARYIAIPMQMLQTGDWLTPRINGVPYFEKPPLFYWLQASMLQLFGTGEFAGRALTILMLSATCIITYAATRMFYSRLCGLLAATVLATSVMGYGLSRFVTLDVPVALFITGCIVFFIAAQYTQAPRMRAYFYLAMYACAALATMTKGLIGIIIPGMVMGAWIIACGKWHVLKEARLVTGTLLFFVIAGPWHVVMHNTHPDFSAFYFIHEHFTRYVSDSHQRTAPWWFFIAIAFAGLLPWSVFLPLAWKNHSRKNPQDVFLLLWIVLPLLFFSLSQSKLLSYIFVIFPPLAIVLARALEPFWTKRSPKYWPKYFIAGIVAVTSIAFISANFLTHYFPIRTSKPLTDNLLPVLKPEDTVVAYESYWQDLPVYLKRNITVAGWAGELYFGITHYPNTHEWMISAQQFWKSCPQIPYNLYVFITEASYQALPEHANCRLQIRAKYGNTVLLERQSP